MTVIVPVPIVPIQIDIVNPSTVVTATQAKAVIAACQIQITRDFAPLWGVAAQLNYIPKGTAPNPNHWLVAILDNADQAGVLGYHDITSKGMPLGKIFAKTTQMYGGQWSVTLSHELLEMLVDPEINLTVFRQSTVTGGTLYAYEVGDPCESETYGYRINSVLVSDFVLPSYFEIQPGTSAPFDFMRKITKPFALLSGGYQSIFQVNRGSGWQQLFASNMATAQARSRVDSRVERREICREDWVFSTNA